MNEISSDDESVDDDFSPQFRPGFCPTMDKRSVANRLQKGENDGQWAIVQSSVANQFTLLQRKQDRPPKTIALRILYYAVPMSQGMQLSVEFSDGTVEYSLTWDDLLNKILKLDPNKGLVVPNEENDVQYVSADAFTRHEAHC
jgi:hypothetical protein